VDLQGKRISVFVQRLSFLHLLWTTLICLVLSYRFRFSNTRRAEKQVLLPRDRDNERKRSKILFNPFTAEVAIMRLLGSALKSHLCDQRRRSKVTGLSDLMTLFIDLGCLCCKQTQRAFNVFKNMLNWLKIDSVDQKLIWLECGNFPQNAVTPGTEIVIAFSQLAVKGLNLKQERQKYIIG
jgi:hypothetical protein